MSILAIAGMSRFPAVKRRNRGHLRGGVYLIAASRFRRVRPHGALGNRMPLEFARPVDGHAHLPALHG
jgi:hypothetical protein